MEYTGKIPTNIKSRRSKINKGKSSEGVRRGAGLGLETIMKKVQEKIMKRKRRR